MPQASFQRILGPFRRAHWQPVPSPQVPRDFLVEGPLGPGLVSEGTTPES